MIEESEVQISPRMQAAIDELKVLILARFPEARFDVRERFDPPGLSLVATTDIEDTDEVVAVVIDRLIDLQVEEGLPLYVVPLQPLARVMAKLREQQARVGPPLLPTG